MKRLRIISAICCTITLTACQPNLPITYAPIIDMKKVDLDKYDADLVECRDYAQQVENDAATAGIMLALLGAGIGAAVGSGYDMAGQGAMYGATTGAVYGTVRGEAEYNSGVKEVIDTCLSGRGYKVLGRS